MKHLLSVNTEEMWWRELCNPFYEMNIFLFKEYSWAKHICVFSSLVWKRFTFLVVSLSIKFSIKDIKKSELDFYPRLPCYDFFFVIFTFCRSEETFLLVSPLVREIEKKVSRSNEQTSSSKYVYLWYTWL